MTSETGNQAGGYVIEPERKVPVVCEADVVVAGSGIAGTFAALTAARQGADTVLIDRFGTLGGNIGPAAIVGGGIFRGAVRGPEGAGMPTNSVTSEFLKRVKEWIGEGAEWKRLSEVISHVAMEMAQEAGVKVMLSTYVADAIVENKCVKGVFVENKSGRQAVKAKVVIDTTGDASVADRAGAAVIREADLDSLRRNIPPLGRISLYNELGVMVTVGGIDWVEYRRYLDAFEGLEDEDRKWLEEEYTYSPLPDPLVPLARIAREKGDYQVPRLMEGLEKVILTWSGKFLVDQIGSEFMHNRILAIGTIDTGNAEHVTLVEAELRKFVFEFTENFLRKYVPGMKNAYVHFISPYLGGRGGPCIDGVYNLQPEEITLKGSKQFDDVIFIFQWEGVDDEAQGEEAKRRRSFNADIPYRILVPKEMDGLLAAGRCAAYLRRGSAPVLRERGCMIAMGHAAGAAAALSSRQNVQPRDLNVKTLQKALLADGNFLGDAERLKGLGL